MSVKCAHGQNLQCVTLIASIVAVERHCVHAMCVHVLNSQRVFRRVIRKPNETSNVFYGGADGNGAGR